MKKIALCVAALLVGTSCFAVSTQSGSAGAGKLGALGALFKKVETDDQKRHDDSVNMVYGGQDVSHLPTIAMHSIV